MSCLCGRVFGNPQFESGEFMQTSTVRRHRVECDSLIVVTRNGSEYWLGKPDPSDVFATQRLLRYLQENESVQVLPALDDHTRMSPVSTASGMTRVGGDRAAANLTMFRRRASDRPVPMPLAEPDVIAAEPRRMPESEPAGGVA